MNRPHNQMIMTELDVKRLRTMIAESRARNFEDDRCLSELDRELNMACVVPSRQVPTDVVTMRSTVSVLWTDADAPYTFTLAYPDEADIEQGSISVLAPLGTAVLGYRVGDKLDWNMPVGRRRITIHSMRYQPERQGDWDS